VRGKGVDTASVSVFGLDMTHAFLNTALYNEVVNEISADVGAWIFARQNEAYGEKIVVIAAIQIP
jgi:hypothetical protein